MKLSLSPPPYADAPVVVLISGLGGSGSYWLSQLAVLDQEYQVVCYDQRGTGNNPDTLAEDYSLAQMAEELHQALMSVGIERYAVIGHALGALVGMQLALDYPASVTALVSVNGWLRINAHTRRCFQVRERLLHSGGAQAWVE
ncbi:TPA: alpha/beta fold hydrolase, partial [Escherichia coli]